MTIDILTSHSTYIAYMKKVTEMTRDLPKTEQQEIRREISSHLYENLQSSPGLSVEQALENFGEPEAYLPEWVILKKMSLAAGSFDPIRIFRALWLGISRHSTHAFKYVLFGILYLLTFAFGALSILKVISPSHTGLLIYPRGFTFGFNSDISGSHEVLGWWFLPISVFITILFYVIITLLLKTSLLKSK
jgi:hypothetical protein